MHKIWKQGIAAAFLLGAMVVAAPQTTYAETTPSVQEVTLAEVEEIEIPTVQEPIVDSEAQEQTGEEKTAEQQSAEISEEITENGAVPAAAEVQPEISAEDAMRQRVVDFGLQFLGAPYADRGSSPETGFDCSGFIRYIFQNGIGIQLERSSRYQSQQGIQISENEMKPGDLIFYGNGSRINHVAMYIGNGQVVHASTYETGVKTSSWNYRPHVRIMRVIGVL